MALAYLPTNAITRHSAFMTETERREPQFLVHVSEKEREELEKKFDSAVRRAGEAGVRSSHLTWYILRICGQTMKTGRDDTRQADTLTSTTNI